MRRKNQCFAEGGTTDAQYGTPGNVRRRQLDDAERESLGQKPRAEPPAPVKTPSIADRLFGKKAEPKTRYATAGVIEGENKDIDEATRARAIAAVAKRRAAQDAEGAGDASAAAEPSFKDAFKAARAGGAKGFSWGGKQFSTELAGKPAVAPPVAAEYGNEGRNASARAANPGYSNEGRNASARAVNPGYSNEGRNAAIPPTYRSEGRNAPVAATYRSEGRNAPVPPSYSNEGRNSPSPDVKRKKVLGPASEQQFMGAAAGGSIGFAKGGSIDGCASRGKTKAKRY
jgi:hypothetical protein